MMHLRYKNARTALKAEMVKLGNKLTEANIDLQKFKDVSLTLHDYDTLLENTCNTS